MADGKETRCTLRIPITENGTLVHVDTREEIPVTIVDVSSKGVRILSNIFFSAERVFILKYAILHKEFAFPVKIKWTLSNSDGYNLGCAKEIPRAQSDLFGCIDPVVIPLA
jgi:hypothetical protein